MSLPGARRVLGFPTQAIPEFHDLYQGSHLPASPSQSRIKQFISGMKMGVEVNFHLFCWLR